MSESYPKLTESNDYLESNVCVLDGDGSLLGMIGMLLHVFKIQHLKEAFELVQKKDIKLVLVDYEHILNTSGVSLLKSFIDKMNYRVPVILFGSESDLSIRVLALEIGCDDYMPYSIHPKEFLSRLQRSIYSKIAFDQLQSRISKANRIALEAVSEQEELLMQVKFYQQVEIASNLDELGLSFFNVLKFYDLKGSLQLRSQLAIKNMEEHGMVKDLESQLLYELKDHGDVYDFGKRMVLNEERVSLFIRTVPKEVNGKGVSLPDKLRPFLKTLQSKIDFLDSESLLALEHKVLNGVSKVISTHFDHTDECFESLSGDLKAAIAGVMEQLGNIGETLDFNTEQRNGLGLVFAHCKQEVLNVLEQGDELNLSLGRKPLHDIVKELSLLNESYKNMSTDQIKGLSKIGSYFVDL